ncbi:hypothetical protein GGTG_03033 [Gaeumannomyces tritici R3-111a-1]|uniref:Uncharacterized protein n=1 Tax=Gaeumannomyces tritici (strain R3-111a-1) TaxID=644352 RepID=J3NP27_GAET3|nr:hypothetical protein GGTG_03033 [Gaeumannomyces tritici R3-111a-1]EJT77930.1 hypothetical protein GGTG_03033 [Gaeumannomyces tritici R3-111a-1]
MVIVSPTIPGDVAEYSFRRVLAGVAATNIFTLCWGRPELRVVETHSRARDGPVEKAERAVKNSFTSSNSGLGIGIGILGAIVAGAGCQEQLHVIKLGPAVAVEPALSSSTRRISNREIAELFNLPAWRRSSSSPSYGGPGVAAGVLGMGQGWIDKECERRASEEFKRSHMLVMNWEIEHMPV